DAKHLAEAALGMGGVGFATVAGEHYVVDETLVGLLEEALDTLDENGALRAKVMGRLAQALYWTHERERIESLAHQAIETARGLGDEETLAYTLNAAHWAIWGPDSVEERLAIATEMLQLAQRSNHKEMTLQGHIWRVADLLELGDIGALETEIQLYANLAKELRQPLYLWYTPLFRGIQAFIEGRLEDAARLAVEALSIGQRGDRGQQPITRTSFTIQFWAVRREQGRAEDMLPDAEAYVQQYPDVVGWRLALAFCYLHLGRESELRSQFGSIASVGVANIPKDFNWLMIMASLAELNTMVGDVGVAAEIYELLLPYASLNIVAGRPPAVAMGPAETFLGMLATTTGRYEEAERHFRRAIELSNNMMARCFLVRAQDAYARMLMTRADTGDRDLALQMATEALASAQELGIEARLLGLEALVSALRDDHGMTSVT
ncbi:MAG: hypothetical protein M3161_00375, partial [Actinomycetota bacterium]|nr:hypothetical protein [Actinomycetota bacterium]